MTTRILGLTCGSRIRSLTAEVLLVAAVLGTLAPVARSADAIDLQVPGKAWVLYQYLKEHGYQNVGVLKFRVKTPNHTESFSVGPLNVAMATRVENALIAHNAKPDAKPIGIIRRAASVAAGKREQASCLTPEGCARLFSYSYPLVCGDEWVKADAFVTGVVTIDAATGMTRVEIEVLDWKSKERKRVCSFEVPTGPTILNDVSVAWDSRTLRSMGLFDEGTIATATAQKAKQANVELEILYDGVKQKVRSVSGEERTAREPQEGQRLTLVLKNNGPEPVAVVLAVGGHNTLYYEGVNETQLDGLHKWILPPGARYEIEGFYKKGDRECDLFHVLSEDESVAVEEQSLEVGLGKIVFAVFLEGKDTGKTAELAQGLRKPLSDSEHPRDARKAAELVRKVTQTGLQSAGLIIADSKTKETRVERETFKNPQQVQLRSITYRLRKGQPQKEVIGK